jgi:hypothetical protein
LSGNLGASVSWNLQDLSRLVMGLLYLYYEGSRKKGSAKIELET